MRGRQVYRMAFGAAVLVAFVGGCTQTCLQKECDWAHIYRQDRIPLSLESDTTEAIVPQVPVSADPSTVADPDRPQRFLSLPEALAMALENGTVGLQSIRTPGLVSDDLLNFAGRAVFGSDAVRVLALDPAIVGADIESNLARFDPVWLNNLSWTATDEPTQGFASFNNGMSANFSSSLAKPLPTGGVAGITFSTDYRLLNNPPTGPFGVVNPTYGPRLQFGVEQPLLRGSGVDINQVLPSFPGSRLFPGVNRTVGSGEGILISRIRFDQQRADFERSIHFLVLNVEAAYWNLYGAYVSLYSAEQGLRQSLAAWSIGKAQFEGGKIDTSQFALLRANYEQFRAARMTALGTVLERERTLRVLIGLPVEDGQRLVPADAPTLTPYQPNWQASLRDCLTTRPELVVAREDLQARHLQLVAQKNGLMPDLRFQATYQVVGLGTRLDGDGEIQTASGPLTSNALRSLAGSHFNNWTVGLNLNMPIGFRAEHATTRQARLELAKSYHLLKDQERRAQITLAKQYSAVIETYKLIEIRRLARIALAEQLETRFRKYIAGAKDSTLEFLLDAQRQWALALNDEYNAIVAYNVALASFEFARGTILERNKVVIAEGPRPYCAEVRAVDHERERTQALILREKANPIVHPPCQPKQLTTGLPLWPSAHAPSLPALLTGAPPLPRNLDALPMVPAALSPATKGPAPAIPLSADQDAAPATTPAPATSTVGPSEPTHLPLSLPGAANTAPMPAQLGRPILEPATEAGKQ